MDKFIYIIKYDAYLTGITQIYNKSYTNTQKALEEKRILKKCGHKNIEIIRTELITK